MNIGVIKFSIRLPANQSLKGKRKIVNSLIQQLKNTFGVSVSEVENQDNLKTATIGICFVSNSSQILQQITSQILSFLQQRAGDFILLEFDQEIISGY
jgi:uncharacterized protein YlxP (DUF503 family)